MADDESDIDVCSVDDDALSIHAGLTAVAAEFYVSSTNAQEDQDVIPLFSASASTSSVSLLNDKAVAGIVQDCQVPLPKNCIATKDEDTLPCDTGNKGTKSCKARDDTLALPHPPNAAKVACREPSSAPGLVGDDDISDKENRLSVDVIVNGTASALGRKRLSDAPPCASDVDDGEESAESVDDDGEVDMGASKKFKQFFFESDHLALRRNKDYQLLVKTLVILEAQRTQAIQDLEKLHQLRNEALADPVKFVAKLQMKESIPFPRRQQIAAIPDINWLHYMTLSMVPARRPDFTRAAMLQKDRELMDQVSEPEVDLYNTMEDCKSDAVTVRGKHWTEDKPVTFNQHWTNEEQEKLEKLLLIYPPEDVESRRWEKIAKALGNRTPKQVASRIQKYFIKLAKAKLPIPGRNPSTSALKNKVNPTSFRNSTFFPSWRPHVAMEDDDQEDSTISMLAEQAFDDESNMDVDDSVPEDLRDTDEYRELVFLQKIKRRELAKKMAEPSKPASHVGFMCDGCGMDPIVGVRWHCCQCSSRVSVDFCNNCSQSATGFGGLHRPWHDMVTIDAADVLDDDYMAFEQRNFKYNYLDPNFVPDKELNPP